MLRSLKRQQQGDSRRPQAGLSTAKKRIVVPCQNTTQVQLEVPEEV